MLYGRNEEAFGII